MAPVRCLAIRNAHSAAWVLKREGALGVAPQWAHPASPLRGILAPDPDYLDRRSHDGGGRVESVGDDLVLCTGGSGLSAAASRGLDSCKSQAVALASTYVHKLTPEAAGVIIEMGLKFERLVDDDKERLSPEEVVLRARRIARDKAI